MNEDMTGRGRPTCWGIYRETSHSPGREGDDEAILNATAARLERMGFDVALCRPDAADAALHRPGACIFSMCERHEIVEALRRARHGGAMIVNPPDAVLNTYRHRTLDLFTRAGISAPPGRLVATDPTTPPPDMPVWIKRYDFHATQPGDVLRAATAAEWRAALGRFAGRGIPFVVIQNHVPGDLIKFYGVRRPGAAAPAWFVWFHHRDQILAGHAVDEAALQKAARAAAAALGVEIFGGDAIVGADGRPMIIDLNAWPSFALYREDAAQAIAEHLAWRFTRQAATAAD